MLSPSQTNSNSRQGERDTSKAAKKYDALPSVKLGDVFQLQFVEHPERGRFSVKVFGYNEGQSLIISAPTNSNGSLLLLHEGQQFVVRSLSGRQVMAFQAEVIKTCMVPYPYVHLRVQRPPERMDVRNVHRVDVEMIASVRPVKLIAGEEVEVEAIAANLVDISTSGCLLSMPAMLDEDLEVLNLSLRFDVAEHNRTLQLRARICSHRESGDEDSRRHLYGVQFDEVEADKRLVLNCFVYERITHEVYD